MEDCVVAVLEGRVHRQRGPEYRVRWAGSDGSDDEWFSAQAVNQDYPDLLFEFENRTGWHPDDKGVFPSTESSFSFVAATATATAPELCEPSSTKKSPPQYSWKSTSQPPPKMTKKELKKSLKVLSKYAAEQDLTKNYADIAVEYRKQVQYIARKGTEENVVGAHSSDPPLCSMCKVEVCRKVFYPCQHVCVCDECIHRHEIGVLDRHDQFARTWNACPLCVQEIKKIVPLHDNSENEYVEWLHEVKPPIPFVDRQQFARVAAMLEKGLIPKNLEHAISPISSDEGTCMPMNEKEKMKQLYLDGRSKRYMGGRGGCCRVS
jgi:hypothetical protein